MLWFELLRSRSNPFLFGFFSSPGVLAVMILDCRTKSNLIFELRILPL